MNNIKYQKVIDFPGIEFLPSRLKLKFIDLHLHFLKNGRFIFTYARHKKDTDHWLIYIDRKGYKSPISALRKIDFKSQEETNAKHPANEDLEIIFNPTTAINNKIWQGLEEQLPKIKLGVSDRDIIHLKHENLRDQIYVLNLITSNFPFIKLFQEFKQQQQPTYGVAERGGHHLFSMITNWVHTIKLIYPYLPAHMPILENTFWFPSISVFRNQLPSTQLCILLFRFITIFTLREKGFSLIERYFDHARPEVLQFIHRYKDDLTTSLSSESISDTILFSDVTTKSDRKIRNDFVEIVEKDIDYLLLQEAIENKTGNNLRKKLKTYVIKEYFIDQVYQEIWWDSFSRHSLFERLDDFALNRNTKSLPQLRPSYTARIKEDTINRFIKSKRKLGRFSAVTRAIPSEELLPILEVIENDWMQHLADLAGMYMSPLMRFEHKAGYLIPQWKLLDGVSGENTMSQAIEWKKQYDENQTKLQAFVTKMPHQKNTIRGRIAQKINLPTALANNQKAKLLVKKSNKSFSVFESYRQEKMVQFGLNQEDLSDKIAGIWLDELLTIEKEISPYILFVKKAFHNALPIRKSVVFNHERHATNGVEFDPQTTQDPQKWMRGEIMTTLKTKIKKGNAIQINAFALDASGSMDHERMRNLFKILTLLVMGLEDRKSFDAFHFFSNTFIEAANFSNQFTSRRLLFNVLRQISVIQNDQVKYGGDGGTNMSAGIRGCTDRINKYYRDLKETNPNTLFLKSLFVITDGEPSLGIIDPKILNQEIKRIRENEDIVIKGIYIKSKEDLETKSFMKEIFDTGEFVEADEFAKAINEFVYIMAQTYKKQRVGLRFKKQ